MLQPTTKQRRVSHVTSTAITTIGLLLGCIASTSAQQPQRTMAAPTSQLSSARLTDLENAFWVCDYLATTQGSSDIAACTSVYEAIKERKFAGDFEKLVAWWRQNKVAQHQSIAAVDSPNQ
jgi:hypothetical protein